MKATRFTTILAIIATAIAATSCSGTAESDAAEFLQETTTNEVVYVNTAEGATTTTSTTMAYANNGKSDFTYAVSASSRANGLEYRSALANVGVELSCENPTLEVRVERVVLENVSNHGTFNFPVAGKPARWSNLSSRSDITLYEGETIVLGSNAIELTAFAIPQSTRGASVAVYCSIYDSRSGAKMWPAGEGSAAATFELSELAWEQNESYTEAISLESVLESISFQASVEDYE